MGSKENPGTGAKGLSTVRTYFNTREATHRVRLDVNGRAKEDHTETK